MTVTSPGPRTRRVLALGLLVGASVGSFAAWRVLFPPASISPSVLPVSGRIEGDVSAVAAKVSGRIREIRVREGDRA